MNVREWERYEERYEEKPKKITKKKKTWKQVKEEKKNKKPKWNKESGVGLSGAKTYFLGMKKLDEKEFDKLWKVMSQEQWDLRFKTTLQNRQNEKRKYEWWKDDESYLDIDR
jgi:molybdenum cofactor biosynthesis enzyme MoaA